MREVFLENGEIRKTEGHKTDYNYSRWTEYMGQVSLFNSVLFLSFFQPISASSTGRVCIDFFQMLSINLIQLSIIDCFL